LNEVGFAFKKKKITYFTQNNIITKYVLGAGPK